MFQIHVHRYPSRRIIRLLKTILREIQTMSVELDRLTSEVADTVAILNVVSAKLDELRVIIADLQGQVDPAKLAQLADTLDAAQQAIQGKLDSQVP